MTDTATVRTQIRTFIEDEYLYLRPDLELTDGDELLTLGVIDSLGFVELVEEVQTRYGVQIADTEITVQNFGSIDAIVAYVERKRA